jgi:hypothetical protein
VPGERWARQRAHHMQVSHRQPLGVVLAAAAAVVMEVVVVVTAAAASWLEAMNDAAASLSGQMHLHAEVLARCNTLHKMSSSHGDCSQLDDGKLGWRDSRCSSMGVRSLCSHCPGDGRLLLQSDGGQSGAGGCGTCSDSAGRSALDLDERATGILNAETRYDGDAGEGEQSHRAAAGSDREQMFRIFRVQQRCRCKYHR